MIYLLLAAQIIDYQACDNHSKSDSHQRAVREQKHNKALKEGISVPPRKVVHNVPVDSAVSTGLQIWVRKRSRQWKSFIT